MTYTKKQFLEDVKKEARALKRNLTKEEANRLDFEVFNPLFENKCVYGLIDGNCRSDRAIELIAKCCPRFFRNGFYSDLRFGTIDTDEALDKNVYGTKTLSLRGLVHISSLEAYIALPEAKNKELFEFLKGNRKDLVL